MHFDGTRQELEQNGPCWSRGVRPAPSHAKNRGSIPTKYRVFCFYTENRTPTRV